ncbi:hypothetical protein GF395_04650, partial [Candidatus Uhrbacteria bacterium]|nr:hypothetical protein [Candidatus Uhrbacteria bacterium]
MTSKKKIGGTIMPEFSEESLRRLRTVDHHLQVLFKVVIQHRDCTILEGYRDQVTQNRYYAEGKSQLQWPDGKHNSVPSKAVDVAPFFPNSGVSMNRLEVVEFGHYVLGVRDCLNMGHKIRWGGDWDGDWLS